MTASPPRRRKALADAPVAPRVADLARAKLESSGLDLADAAALGIEVLDPVATAALHPMFKPVAALRFHYFDPFGLPLPDWTGCPPYWRVRYLEQPTDFQALTDKKPTRYLQLPATAPTVYYPRTQSWALLADASEPLIITEGELKAAKACKAGFPTIGLGGVHAWKAARLGLDWLPTLDFVTWPRRNVYLCFDSDYRENKQVLNALVELAEALQQRGAFPHLVSLPTLDGFEKVGLDDFLTFGGPTAETQFAELLHAAEPLGLARPLWQLNQRYAYICDPGLIINLKTHQKVLPTAFTGHLEAAATYQERVVRRDGSVGFEPTSAASAWLRWPLRLQADRLTYMPGKPPFVTNGVGLYNTWRGWGVEPAAGDVSAFLRLVDHLFTGAEPGAREWFLKWCAYPLQYPGVKLFSSVLIWGRLHGTGKSLLGYTLGRIYGVNFVEIGSKQLHGDFNAWAVDKQFAMGDDVTGSDKRLDNDELKRFITQKTIEINVKFMPQYVVPDCLNYYFSSNHPDSFFLEDDDRRNFIHEVTVGALDEEFYLDYDLQLDGALPSAVFDYLLKLDVSDFNPAGRAFATAAKQLMISDMQSDLGSWIRDLLATPDATLRLGELALRGDLWSSRQLLELYDPHGKTRTTANGLTRELRRVGCPSVLRGLPVRLPDGSQARLFAVRNGERWAAASAAEVAAHLRETASNQAKKY